MRLKRGTIFDVAPVWVDPLLLVVLFGFSLFQSLGVSPLLNPDEGRYAEVPREMLESGDFITPHLNYVLYLEKPPLHYWLTALSFRLFGETEFAVRATGALAGLGGILLVWGIGKRAYGRRAGMLSALVLGTSIGYLVQGRLAILDMLLTCLIAASLGSFLLAATGDEQSRNLRYYSFYLFAALAVLTKGLVGIALPAAVVLLYVALRRRWELLTEMRIPEGAALFLLVAAPWFVAAGIRNPEFPRFFFIHEHFQRYLTTIHHRYEPFWFFAPVLVGLIFPWSCFLPAVAARLRRQRTEQLRDVDLFLAIWAVLVFVFFSFSHSKLVPYILPMFPPAALLIGGTLSDLMDGDFRAVRREAWFLHAVLLGGAAGILLYSLLAPRPAIGPFGCAAISAMLLAEGLIVGACRRRASAAGLVLCLCLMTYLEGVAGPPFVLSGMQQKRSMKELALAVAKLAKPGDAVVCFSIYAQDLPFYLKRRVVLVGDTADLEFGSARGDQSQWFIDEQTFYGWWNSPGRLFVLADTDDAAAIRRRTAGPMRICGRKGAMLVIANR